MYLLYYIIFLLSAIALYEAEELVVLITPCLLSALTVRNYRAFQTSVLAKTQLKMQNE